MAYSPASVVTGSGLPNSLAVFYDRVCIRPVWASTPFLASASLRPLPKNSGKTIQLFAYNVLAANTTASAEGTVGSGEALTSTDVQATLASYSDFASFSELLTTTAIDPILESAAELLGEQAALSINTLVQQTMDSAITNDATANFVVASGNLTSAVVRQRVADLQGRNAKGVAQGLYFGYLHPFVAADLLNDSASNSFVDVVKRIPQVAENLLLKGNIDSLNYELLGDFGGVRWFATTTCPSVSGIPASGDTAYNTYIVAKDAHFAVSLGGAELPGDKNFKTMVSTFRPSVADPALTISSAVAYHVHCAFAIRPGTVSLVERIQSMTSTT